MTRSRRIEFPGALYHVTSRGDRREDIFVDDACILGFTSGTTGAPKATMSFHPDAMAICRCRLPHALRASANDVFIGGPPMGFTVGLGGLLLFRLDIGASTVLPAHCTPAQVLLDGIRDFGATVPPHGPHTACSPPTVRG